MESRLGFIKCYDENGYVKLYLIKAAKNSAVLGGDTDPIGAIATAVCGGMNPNIDESLVEVLEKVNSINFNQLSEGIVKYSPFFDDITYS